MAKSNLHQTLGAWVTADATHFRVWAPHTPSLAIELSSMQSLGSTSDQPPLMTSTAIEPHEMQRCADGYFELELPGNLSGSDYHIRFPDGRRRPDPASRFQPAGVHGPSRIVDSRAYRWRDQTWRGVAKSDLLIYELHLGAFTEDGTYAAAAERLSELKELGVTAVELMPLAESAGSWNWGYDGVLFYAPHHTHGSPDDFRKFVDRAHELGLAVILDVVYNHFGPEGNYFRDFGPYISEKHSTAWGDAPNFDGAAAASVGEVLADETCQAGKPDVPGQAGKPDVREYFTANVSYWIDEFHLDGLRIDAIHCMADDSRPHIVTDLAATFAQLRDECSRQLHLIAESNVYDARMLQPRDGGGHGYDAEWCDDFLHSVFAVLRPGEQMSQRVYGGYDLQPVLQRGYVYAGSMKVLRQRISLEDDPQRADLSALIYSIQNHDFIGNHPLGQRLHQLTSDNAHRAATALLLLVPAIPMLFMGEEFACPNPFNFFVDYGEPHLREAVERGRKAEYPQHDWSGGTSPTSPAAFAASKLGPTAAGNQHTLDWYRSLIVLRKAWQQAELLTAETLHAEWHAELQTAVLHYQSSEESRFVVVRLSSQVMQHPSVNLELSGEIQLSQNCEVNNDERQAILHDNAVAIGRGSVVFRGR